MIDADEVGDHSLVHFMYNVAISKRGTIYGEHSYPNGGKSAPIHAEMNMNKMRLEIDTAQATSCYVDGSEALARREDVLP